MGPSKPWSTRTNSGSSLPSKPWSTGTKSGSSLPSKPWSTWTKSGSSLPSKPWSTRTNSGSSLRSKPWSTGTKFESPPTSTTSIASNKFGSMPFSKTWSGKKTKSPPTSTTSSTSTELKPSSFWKPWSGKKSGSSSTSTTSSTGNKFGTSTAESTPGSSTSLPGGSVNDSPVPDNQNPVKPQTSTLEKISLATAGVNAAANIGQLGIGAAQLIETKNMSQMQQEHQLKMLEKEKDNQMELIDAEKQNQKELMNADRENNERILKTQAELEREILIIDENQAQKEDRSKGIEEMCINCNQKIFQLNLKRSEAAENKCLESLDDPEMYQLCVQKFFADTESSEDIFENVGDEEKECFKAGSDYFIKAQRFPDQCFRDREQFHDVLDLACNFEKSSNIDQWCYLKSQNFDDIESTPQEVDQVEQIDVQDDQNEGLEATCSACYQQFDLMASSMNEVDAYCKDTINENEYNLCKKHNFQVIFNNMGGQENDCLKNGSDFFKIAQSKRNNCFESEEHLIWTLELACHYGNANNIDQWCLLQSDFTN